MKKTFTLKDIRITQANRDVLEGHVEKLKQLIQKHGYIKSLPIIVDPDGCIIDGQHRYLACKELKIEPTIIVEEDDFHALVPVINANQKKWNFADFVIATEDLNITLYWNNCAKRRIYLLLLFTLLFTEKWKNKE